MSRFMGAKRLALIAEFRWCRYESEQWQVIPPPVGPCNLDGPFWRGSLVGAGAGADYLWARSGGQFSGEEYERTCAELELIPLRDEERFSRIVWPARLITPS